MDLDSPPLPKKEPLKKERLFPGLVTRGILIFLLVAILIIRLGNESIEAGGLDEAAANLGTYVAIVLGLITLWAWFSFRSTYAFPLRIGVMVLGALIGLFLIASVRLDGITGNWIPTGVRWSWQKSRDFTLAKPPANAVSSSEGSSAAELLPLETIESTPNDFPQFLGPNRNGVIESVELAKDWNATPPKILWQQRVGAGWTGFAVVADRAVTLEQYGEEELITCRDLADGKVIWSHASKARHEEFMGGIGPRSTPTIHESKVYTVGATGLVTCLHLSNGQVVWQDDLRKRYEISKEQDLAAVMWGRANSPLIYQNLCIVPAGGLNPPNSLIAYDKETGKKVWEGGNTQISYASPVVMNITGKDQIVSVNESNVTGHEPETGKQLWKFDWPGRSNMNASASQPHLLGENQIFISKGYDEGSAVFQVAELGGEYRTEQVWKEKRSMQTKFTNAVITQGHAFGLSDGIFQCIDLADGKRKWTKGRYGHGQILLVGDVILVQTEKTGELVMLAADPKKHQELGRFKTFTTASQAWNNLCLTGKKLLIRNADEALCIELP